MPPTLADRVRHILEGIDEIERAVANKTLEKFTANRLSIGRPNNSGSVLVDPVRGPQALFAVLDFGAPVTKMVRE